MLQACIPNVSSVFQKHVAGVFILGVAIWMLRMFCNDFLSVFFSSSLKGTKISFSKG